VHTHHTCVHTHHTCAHTSHVCAHITRVCTKSTHIHAKARACPLSQTRTPTMHLQLLRLIRGRDQKVCLPPQINGVRTNMRTHMYTRTSAHIHSHSHAYTRTQHANMRTWRVCRRAFIRSEALIGTSTHPSIQASKHPSIQASNHPSIQASKHPSIQASKQEYPRTRSSSRHCFVRDMACIFQGGAPSAQ
jgi:hypothetical protein